METSHAERVLDLKASLDAVQQQQQGAQAKLDQTTESIAEVRGVVSTFQDQLGSVQSSVEAQAAASVEVAELRYSKAKRRATAGDNSRCIAMGIALCAAAGKDAAQGRALLAGLGGIWGGQLHSVMQSIIWADEAAASCRSKGVIRASSRIHSFGAWQRAVPRPSTAS